MHVKLSKLKVEFDAYSHLHLKLSELKVEFDAYSQLHIKPSKLKVEFDAYSQLHIKPSKLKAEFDAYSRLHIKLHFFHRPFDAQRLVQHPQQPQKRKLEHIEDDTFKFFFCLKEILFYGIGRRKHCAHAALFSMLSNS